MVQFGDSYGFSIENENTNSLFKGFSIELEINLIITVYDSMGEIIDDTCVVSIYDASDNTLLNSGNTTNGVFTYSVADPISLKITAQHPVEGEISKTFTHPGSGNVVQEIISFVPTVLKFHEVNPIRIVLTSSPQIEAGSIRDTFYIDSGDFYEVEKYEQKFNRSDIVKVQFDSNYQDLNEAKLYRASDDVLIDTIEALLVTDLYDTLAYGKYEVGFNWAQYPADEYYIIFSGTDAEQGDYEARSEPILIADSHRGTVKIDYKNYDSVNDVDYRSGIEFLIRFEGKMSKQPIKGQVESFKDPFGRTVKTETQLYKCITLELQGLPPYVFHKVSMALAHDYVMVNNQWLEIEEVLTNDEIDEEDGLIYGSIDLMFQGFSFQNYHDSNKLSNF